MAGHDRQDDDDLDTGDELLRDIAHVSDAPVPAEDDDDEPLEGKTVGHFRVIEKLGSGGMGIVYRAEDETLRREVALKLLRAAHARDDERRLRFLREARSASAIAHPNIANVYEIGEDGERVYIAMELVRGESLRAVLARGPIPREEALRIGIAVAQALAKAHGAGIVHRDVKPDNVMIEHDGGVKVLDFGLAKVLATKDAEPDASETELTADGRILGTPSYMSPEQASGRPTDARSDVFSLGVVLYEMLAGKRPFVGESTLDVLVSISRDEPPPLASRAPSVPKTVAAVVERCLRKGRDARPADGGELVSALEHAISERGQPRIRAMVLVALATIAVAVVATLAARSVSAGAGPSASSALSAVREAEPGTLPSTTPSSAATIVHSASTPSAAYGGPPSASNTVKAASKARPAGSLDPLGDQK